MPRLANKVALITGASAGIGAKTAELFAAEGAKVVVAGLKREDAEPVVARIVEAGGQAIAAGGDLTSEDEIRALVDTAIGAYGRIDVLHSNAALTDPAALARDLDVATMDAELWRRTFAINLIAPALLCKYVIPGMIRQGGGSIVMTGSGKGTQGDLMNTAYGVSKAGLINLAQNIAAQYGKQSVRCNVLIVGLVMTEALAANMPEAFQTIYTSHHLTPRLGRPLDIARAALFLASDESEFVTAHALEVDGGLSSHTPAFADLQRMFATHS